MLDKTTILYKTLARALSMMRPHNSEGTKRLTQWLKDKTPKHARVSVDQAGNLHVDTRISQTNRTLFVAHVDTVHRKPGPNKITKTTAKWSACGAPLGADDGAGVAMLMHLLHSGVNAYFIFTQGEECGGIGATFLATKHAALLSEFDRAIAFDRRGIDSVITHQGWGRCCSDKFAEALADALNDDMTLMYLPDDTGVYTDTAEFTDVIPECTNISVGYYHEHSDREYLDIAHFVALAERVAKIDWDALPTDRDPSVTESKWDKWVTSDWGTGVEKDWVWNYSGKDTNTKTTKHARTHATTRLDNGYYHWDSDTDYNYDMRASDDLHDALHAALNGDKQWLVELMAESVYPEDPQLAMKAISRKKLTPSLIATALDDCAAFDPDTVMCYLFDQVYSEV